MDTFTPSINPSYGFSRDTSNRILKVSFGDGYEQRSVDGLNAQKITLSLSWGSITKAQRDEFKAFLDDKMGSEAFYYTLPDEVTPRKFVCSSPYKDTYSNSNSYNFSCTFEEVFDL
jgi:phage-related protein